MCVAWFCVCIYTVWASPLFHSPPISFWHFAASRSSKQTSRPLISTRGPSEPTLSHCRKRVLYSRLWQSTTMCPHLCAHMYRTWTEYSAHGVGRLKPTKMCNFVFPKSGKIIYTDIVISIQLHLMFLHILQVGKKTHTFAFLQAHTYHKNRLCGN